MARAKSKAAYMISAVAEQYAIHPQTCGFTSAKAAQTLAQRRQYAAVHA